LPVQKQAQSEEANEPHLILHEAQQAEIVSVADAPPSPHIHSVVPSEVPSVESKDIRREESLPMSAPEPPAQLNLQPAPLPKQPLVEQVQADMEIPAYRGETAKQRRKREAEEEWQREEQERLDQESFEQYRIDQERLEMARLEQKRLERERARQERLQKEKIEQARLEKERAEQDRLEKERAEMERVEKERAEMERVEKERAEMERLEQERVERERLEKDRLERERIEQEKLEQERLDIQRLQEETIEKERLEIQRINDEALEQKRVEQEARAVVEAAELEMKKAMDAEAARITKEHEVQIQEFAEKIAAEVNVEHTTSSSASSVPQERAVFEAAPGPTHLSTPPPETIPQPLAASSSVRTSNPVSRLPTPAASVGRSSSPRSVATDAPRTRAYAPEPSPHTHPAHRPENVDQITNGRHTTGSPALPAPRPQAVSHIIEDNRPPAPSPPVARARPRHIPAFDSEDDSDSALIRPRRQFRGGEARDGSSGSAQGYPPQPAHHRSVFASRVPAEPSYSNPPPPQPPGYHPGYYPPTAPPHYQNHNYRVSQQSYPHPNSYGPPSHSSSSPYTEPWNYPPGYRHDSPPQRHDTLVTRDYPLGLAPIDTRSPLGDDPGDVFSRIAQAIPDLHVLLARYKETHGQLSVREELLRRSAVEQEERLRVKDDEIAELKERTRSVEHKYSTEASRLRLQIGNLEEQARELQEQRAETEKFKKEAHETRTALDAAMKSWEAKYRELEEAHATLARTSAEEKAKAYQDFAEWKSSYTTRNDAEKIALAIQFDKRLKEADVLADNQRQEAAAAHVNEKDELRSEHQRQQLERQASFDRVRNELETKLGAAQIDREEALKHERESREVWLAEREALIKSHQDDRESTRKGWDEQRDLLEAQYKKSKDESDQAWIELHADASRKADEERAKVDQLIKEREELQKKYNALKAESEKEKAIIKSVATNLESEKSRLEKLMECYGDIAEIKSKGDTY
jgi:serine/arginine repetitive matrix protein 2